MSRRDYPSRPGKNQEDALSASFVSSIDTAQRDLVHGYSFILQVLDEHPLMKKQRMATLKLA